MTDLHLRFPPVDTYIPRSHFNDEVAASPQPAPSLTVITHCPSPVPPTLDPAPEPSPAPVQSPAPITPAWELPLSSVFPSRLYLASFSQSPQHDVRDEDSHLSVTSMATSASGWGSSRMSNASTDHHTDNKNACRMLFGDDDDDGGGGGGGSGEAPTSRLMDDPFDPTVSHLGTSCTGSTAAPPSTVEPTSFKGIFATLHKHQCQTPDVDAVVRAHHQTTKKHHHSSHRHHHSTQHPKHRKHGNSKQDDTGDTYECGGTLIDQSDVVATMDQDDTQLDTAI